MRGQSACVPLSPRSFIALNTCSAPSWDCNTDLITVKQIYVGSQQVKVTLGSIAMVRTRQTAIAVPTRTLLAELMVRSDSGVERWSILVRLRTLHMNCSKAKSKSSELKW